ncbi:hypothetical protein B4U80_14377, partial [Leptotrombidium deliense]
MQLRAKQRTMNYIILYILILHLSSTKALKEDCGSNPEPFCDEHYEFRTADGSCNNLKYKEWGQSYRCYPRFGPSNYPDYYGRNITNELLANPRDLGNA